MKAQLLRAHWFLVALTAALVYVLTLLLGVALSVPFLMLLQGGHLNARSAWQASVLLSAVLVIVVTGAGAFVVSRMVDRAAVLHGFLVGLLVALISCVFDRLFGRAFHLVGLVLYALMLVAGWLGGALATHWPRPSTPAL